MQIVVEQPFKIFKIKNIIADVAGSKLVFDVEGRDNIIVNVSSKNVGKRKVYDIVSVDGFPDCKYIDWSSLKELEIR